MGNEKTKKEWPSLYIQAAIAVMLIQLVHKINYLLLYFSMEKGLIKKEHKNGR